jgi:DNA-binding transcriptional LysR family regulator
VRRLETRLGIRLLTRTTRSVAPTEAGERLIATLRPAFDDIEGRLAALSELRDKPAGTVRLSTSAHAAQTVVWPALTRFMPEHPDIKVELSIDSSFADIVAGRFDAGVRLGEHLAADMIAVPVGPDLRMAVVGAPSYFAGRSVPEAPHDLTGHACINLRLWTNGGLYIWEFEKDGRELNVRVDGPLVLNDMAMILDGALMGLGLAFVMEDQALPLIAEGRLVRVLEEWCPWFAGYHLYYPSRRQTPPAFTALMEFLRYRPVRTSRNSG